MYIVQCTLNKYIQDRLCMKLWQRAWTGRAHLPTFNWAVRLRRRMDGALSWLPRLRLWPNNLINRQGRPKATTWHAFIIQSIGKGGAHRFKVKTDRKPSWIFNSTRVLSPPCWNVGARLSSAWIISTLALPGVPLLVLQLQFQMQWLVQC